MNPARRFERGLIVGKFCPLHRGHEYAINTMLQACKRSFIISYARPEFPGFEPERRRRWLHELFPDAVSLVPETDEAPPDDADDLTHRSFIARLCLDRLGTTVDAVFSSEAYGEGFARELTRQFGHDVTHVPVDPGRKIHPISGTQLRADLHAHRHQMHPDVYADFVERVCVLGGESSGKSTLAAELAARFGTCHVPEYGRELWEARGGRLEFDDLLHVARTQVSREESGASSARHFLFCDTSPLTTLFYSRHLFGRAEPELEALAGRRYALHLLCAPDFPFQQDGTRQDARFRAIQHAWYKNQLERRRLPWICVAGSIEQRVARVAKALRGMVDGKAALQGRCDSHLI